MHACVFQFVFLSQVGVGDAWRRGVKTSSDVPKVSEWASMNMNTSANLGGGGGGGRLVTGVSDGVPAPPLLPPVPTHEYSFPSHAVVELRSYSKSVLVIRGA